MARRFHGLALVRTATVQKQPEVELTLSKVALTVPVVSASACPDPVSVTSLTVNIR